MNPPQKPTTYVCRACQFERESQEGRCIGCGGLYRAIESGQGGPNRSTFAKAAEVKIERHSTSIEGFDKVMAGGLVHGTAIILAGQHGAGKSTLAVMVLSGFAELHGVPCLYASAEESVEGVLTIVQRCKAETERVEAMHEGYLPRVIAHAKKTKARLVAFDSFNRYAGDVTAEKAAVHLISKFVRETGAVALVINQLTKAGTMKGSTEGSHGFDVELFLGAARADDMNAPFPSRDCDDFGVRVLYANKNRRGALGLTYWEMNKAGILKMVEPRPAMPARKRKTRG